jgi:hypothetical protein
MGFGKRPDISVLPAFDPKAVPMKKPPDWRLSSGAILKTGV